MNLPDHRVNHTVLFQVCGVYYLGPVFVRDIYYSSNNDMHKAYIVLFTCSTSRAVILDLVEDNTSEIFINSIKKLLQEEVVQQTLCLITGKCLLHRKTSLFCVERGITWRFNLDGVSWWGGFWERLVSMVKSCLKKLIGKEKLSFTELLTIFV